MARRPHFTPGAVESTTADKTSNINPALEALARLPLNALSDHRARAYSTISENDLTDIGLLGGLNAARKLAREEFGEARLGFQQKTFDVLVVSGPAVDRCGFPLFSELAPKGEDKDAAARG